MLQVLRRWRAKRRPRARAEQPVHAHHSERVHVRHRLPGRMRVRVVGLYRSPELATWLEREVGLNRLAPPRTRSGVEIALGQLQSTPVLMLLGSAALAIATAAGADAVVILAVVGINALIGYLTESSSERTIRSLGEGEPSHA